MNDRQALIEFEDATGVGIYQGRFANGCCGDPDCGYGSRQARYPDPLEVHDRALRWPTRIACVLAVLGMAFIAGSVAMRVL